VPGIPTITVPLPRNAAQRPADLLRPIAFGAVVLALEAGLAHGVVGPQLPRILLLFAAVAAAAFVLRFPLLAALVLLALTDFLFFPTFFAFPLGAIDVRPPELILTGLLALAVARPQRRSWGGRTGVALVVFLGFVAASAVLAIAAGRTGLTAAFNSARPLYLLAFFYVVVRLFPSSEQRRTLLLGTAVLAALTGVIALMAAVGAGFANSLVGSGGQVVEVEGAFNSIARVRLPGLSAGYALFWFAIVQITARRGASRLGWSLIFAGIALDILVSFNRNMWIGIAIGFVLMAIVGGQAVRNRVVASLAVLLAALSLFVLFGSSVASDKEVQPILQRGETLLNPSKTGQENSLAERASETTKAWHAVEPHLLLGIGAGAPFGVSAVHPLVSGTFAVGFLTEPQLFLHDQYLYLVLIAGIPGLIAFLFFLGMPLAHALRRAPPDPAIAACGVGIALIMISSVVAIYFTVADMTAILGLLAGVLIADAEGPAADHAASGLTS
jgi:O-antigen ligase